MKQETRGEMAERIYKSLASLSLKTWHKITKETRTPAEIVTERKSRRLTEIVEAINLGSRFGSLLLSIKIDNKETKFSRKLNKIEKPLKEILESLHKELKSYTKDRGVDN